MLPNVQHTTPERMVIREGGGCLALFGVPFLLAGIFMVLVGLGIVPMSNADEVPLWSWPLIVLMGLVFVAAGGGLTFGRSWTVLDRGAGSIVRQWGLLVPLKQTTLSLSSYDAVVLGFDRGDSDSADRYPVSLRPRDASETLKLYSPTDYGDANTRAKALAAFLSLPLEDATTAHPRVYQADRLDESLHEHLRSVAEAHSSVPRPPQLRSQTEIASGALQIMIPGTGFRPATLLQFVIPLGILTYFAPSLLVFFQQTETPPAVAWLFLGFMLIFFVALPTIGGISGIIRDIRRRTRVTVSPVELVIEEHGALRTRTTRIPTTEIVGLDYDSSGSLLSAAQQMAEQRVGTVGSPASGPGGGGTAPWWLSALSRIVRSKGITVKHGRGLVTFGAGLPDDEVRYLWAIISSELARAPQG